MPFSLNTPLQRPIKGLNSNAQKGEGNIELELAIELVAALQYGDTAFAKHSFRIKDPGETRAM